ncbi:sensor domain-containing phosphodiesterase [Sphingomonas endolithica]|uniref:sensor domain-containing phosphodiesterase n=1 Tax=Sphingomonas endolithica TaxID=2972485 RepID=UPI0021AF343A|nr:sensor domain-containing phosphodiesterase [Sphingomonas sp. ZFBP2030]
MRSEEARLDALYQLNLLDTPPSESFDRITRMAAQIFNLPIAAVSLTDHDRQWFKSRVGVDHQSIPRHKAPCALVAERTESLVITDLLSDNCFAESPLAATGVRFYAGVPLVTPGGHGLGALCVLGTEPRATTEAEMRALRDLGDIVMSQIELQHAFGRIDPLSGLPNRSQLLEDLDDLGRDDPGRRRLLVLVDLARSDQLDQGLRVMGPAFVDDVVQEAAAALRSMFGTTRTAYHIGTTQFAFLAPPDVKDDEYAMRLATTLSGVRATARARFVMTVTIGVAPFVTGVGSAADPLRAAYGAAQDARAANLTVSFHSPAMDGAQTRRFDLLRDFESAIDHPGQLRLMCQPRIDLATGRCDGGEALLRWQHPTLGDISPAEFIPIIERTAMVGPTTAWVLDAAVAQIGAWRAAGLDLRLSVNISAANLEEADFAARVQLMLLKYRVPADRLELEITESAMMGNADLALAQLTLLAESGVTIAIDDFGTGYSSLAYLQRLPVQVVKIDQSFVRGLGAGCERDDNLVRSMITMSHGLGYRVVGEGVETAAAADLLRDMGCDEAQGYLFARPLEMDDVAGWMAMSDTAGLGSAAA